MTIGVIGRKAGMTRVFTEDGVSIPVTVIEVAPNRVSQIRNQDIDGYSAVQVTAGQRKASRVTKPMAGHFAKAAVEAGSVMTEFRLHENEGADLEVGKEMSVDMFQVGQKVDVRGRTKGRGFAGGIRRHNFRAQRMTHGNSLSHRSAGSIGQCQTPGRVFKGKKMPGRMGNKRVTSANIKVALIDKERNLLGVSGSVPGAKGGLVMIKERRKQ